MTLRRSLGVLLAAASVGAAAVAVGPTAGAAEAPAAVTAGTTTITVDVGGTTRSAVVHVPAAVAADARRRVPLVLHLHGFSGAPDASIATTGLVEAADADGFIVAFPQGTPLVVALPGGRTGYAWNAGGCCGVAVREEVDDVAFLRALIAELTATLPVDADRVVMSGHSNGAMMTWRFACEAGGVLAAAMPVAGSLETADPGACRPRGTSLLAVHGDADQIHPIAGGTSGPEIARVAFHPFADSVAAYATASGCAPRPRVTDASITTTTRYRHCARDARVESVVLHGADHPWPGGTSGGLAGSGVAFADWSATAAVVDVVDRTG